MTGRGEISMKNAKRLVALSLSLMMILSTMTVAMAATTNDAKARILYDLGLFKGISTTEYVPALEMKTDALQAIVLIGRALQWDVDEDATVTFTDVPDWAVPHIAYAVDAGITNGVSATEFGPDIISGKRIVAWFLRALGYDNTESWTQTDALAAVAGIPIPGDTLRDDVVGVIYTALQTTPVGGDATLIESIVEGDALKTAIAKNAGLIDESLSIISVKHVGLKEVEVKLNDSVKTSTTTVQIKKGSAIYSKTVTWNSAKDTATVTTFGQLPEADYTVTVKTSDETLTKDYTVSDIASKATEINITSNTIDDDVSDAKVYFEVIDQYGDDMDIDANESGLIAVAYNVDKKENITLTKPNDPYFLIVTNANEDDFESGDTIRFTITYLGITEQDTLRVQAPGTYNSIVLGDVILDEDDTKLDELDDTFELDYLLTDQYGDVVDLEETAVVASLPAVIDGINFVTSDTDVISGIKIVDDEDDKGRSSCTSQVPVKRL